MTRKKMYGRGRKVKFCREQKKRFVGDDACIVPWGVTWQVVQFYDVSLRRDEGIPPYRYDVWYTL